MIVGNQLGSHSNTSCQLARCNLAIIFCKPTESNSLDLKPLVFSYFRSTRRRLDLGSCKLRAGFNFLFSIRLGKDVRIFSLCAHSL